MTNPNLSTLRRLRDSHKKWGVFDNEIYQELEAALAAESERCDASMGRECRVICGNHGGTFASTTGTAPTKTPLCHAGKDGDCSWSECPQLHDGEPKKSGRHCPIDHGIDCEEYGLDVSGAVGSCNCRVASTTGSVKGHVPQGFRGSGKPARVRGRKVVDPK